MPITDAVMTNRGEQDILNHSFDHSNGILQTEQVQIDQITGLPVVLSGKVNGGVVQLLAEYSGSGSSKVLLYLGVAARGTAQGTSNAWKVYKFTYDSDYDFTSMTSGIGSWTGRASITYA